MSRLVPNIELQGNAGQAGLANEWQAGVPIVCGVRRGVITNSQAGLQTFGGVVGGAITGTWTKPSNLSPNSTTRVILVGPGGGGGPGACWVITTP